MLKPVVVALGKPGNPYSIGDQVHLKSGGPLMTVETPGPEWTEATWFDEVGNRMCERFRNGTLMPYRPKPKPKRPPVTKARASR